MSCWVRQAVAALGALLACGFAIPAYAGPALHGDVYVDCSAEAAGDGTIKHPFNALSSVAADVSPGTQLLFRRGAVCHGRLQFRGSGTADAPIHVGAYGRGSALPIIEADGVAGLDEVGAAVSLVDQQFVDIADLEITNHGDAPAVRSGVVVEMRAFPGEVAHAIHLERLFVHDVNGGGGEHSKDSNGIGFVVRGTSHPMHFDDISVTDSRIEHVDREGLTTFSVQQCRTFFTCAPSPTSANAWSPSTHVVFARNHLAWIGGDGIVVRVTRGAVVKDTEAAVTGTRSWERAQHSSAALWTINSEDTLFEGNDVHDTQRLPGNNDGTAFDADFTTNRVSFIGNRTHDNLGGFLLLCGGCVGTRSTSVIVRDNVSHNDGDQAARLISGAGIGYIDAQGRKLDGATLCHNRFELAPELLSARGALFTTTGDVNIVSIRGNTFVAGSTAHNGQLKLVTGQAPKLFVSATENEFVGLAAPDWQRESGPRKSPSGC